MNEERFVKIVEDDLQLIGRWVTLQSESLHTKLSQVLTNCSNQSYPVDYLRGASHARAPGACERCAEAAVLSQSKRTRSAA